MEILNDTIIIYNIKQHTSQFSVGNSKQPSWANIGVGSTNIGDVYSMHIFFNVQESVANNRQDCLEPADVGWGSKWNGLTACWKP